MDTILNGSQLRRLAEVFESGAANASAALSKWLGRPVRLMVSRVDQPAIEDVDELLGPPDQLVTACSMALKEVLPGELILVFGDRSGLALGDLLLGRAPGSSTEWGELEKSAAMETANIVGCAYLNAISKELSTGNDGERRLSPGPPRFVREFAASLLEFAVMDQAMVSDRLLLIRTVFETETSRLDWSLLFVPAGDLLSTIQERFVKG